MVSEMNHRKKHDNVLILEFNPDFPLIICMQLFREVVKTVHLFVENDKLILDSMSSTCTSLCRLEMSLEDDEVFLNTDVIQASVQDRTIHLIYDSDQMYRILQAANEFDRVRWKIPFNSNDFLQITITNEDMYYWSVNLSLIDKESDMREEPLDIPDFDKVLILLDSRLIRDTVNHFAQFADVLKLYMVLDRNYLVFHSKTEMLEMNYVLKTEEMSFQTLSKGKFNNLSNSYQLSLLRKFVQIPHQFVERLEWYVSPGMPLGMKYTFSGNTHLLGFLGIYAC